MICPHAKPTHFPYTTLFRSTPRGWAPVTGALALPLFGFYLATLAATLRPLRAARLTPMVVASSLLLLAPLANFRSEEHTSELQSQSNLVCRLLLEKKKVLNDRPPSSLHDKVLLGRATEYTPAARPPLPSLLVPRSLDDSNSSECEWPLNHWSFVSD